MIFALIIAILIPIMGVPVSIAGLGMSPSKWRRYLPFLIYAFFIGAYAFIPPDDGYDLCRYLPLVEQYGKLSFIDALRMDEDVLYASHVLFWICGRLHLPHLAPAITTASVYGIGFYITCDTAYRYEEEGGPRYIAPLILLQIAMMPYIMIINNVRNVFGLSLVALAAYLDIVKKNRKWYVFLLYISGSLFHLSAFAFVVFRIICGFTKKIFGIVVLFPLIFSPMILFLNAYIDKIPIRGAIGNSIRGIIWRLYGYLTYRDIGYAIIALKSKTVLLDKIAMMVGMILTLAAVLYFLRSGRKNTKDDPRIYSFIGLIAVMTISISVFAMPNFWRFAAALYVVFGVIAIPVLVSYREMPIYIKASPFIFTAMGVCCFLLQYIRYDLSNVADWLSSAFLMNGFTVMYDLLLAI